MQVDVEGGAGEAGVWDLPSTEEVEMEVEGSGGAGSGGRATPAGTVSPVPEAVLPARGRSAASQEAAQPTAAAAAPAPAAAAAAGRGGCGGACAGAGGSLRRAGGCWPARMPRPSDMLLQRTSIFYCASFPRKPGLTSQRASLLSKMLSVGDVPVPSWRTLGCASVVGSHCPEPPQVVACTMTLCCSCCTAQAPASGCPSCPIMPGLHSMPQTC